MLIRYEDPDLGTAVPSYDLGTQGGTSNLPRISLLVSISPKGQDLVQFHPGAHPPTITAEPAHHESSMENTGKNALPQVIT